MSIFWEGTGGALIGAALSGIVAVLAVIWTRRDERQLMREQMSLTTAYELLGFAREVRQRVDPFIVAHRPETKVNWAEVESFVATAEADGDSFLAYQSVIRPLRIVDHLVWLWDELGIVEETLTPAVITKRDRARVVDPELPSRVGWRRLAAAVRR